MDTKKQKTNPQVVHQSEKVAHEIHKYEKPKKRKEGRKKQLGHASSLAKGYILIAKVEAEIAASFQLL